MMLRKFALLPLVVSMGMASSQHPSAAEFNLFCRILGKANDMMYGSNYVYNENVDRAIMREMEELYNITTGNMNDFGKMLWKTKDFLTDHPPPKETKNLQEAHRKIGKLIDEGEKKIEENRKIAVDANKKIDEAKLYVAKGIYGEHVTEVPKEDGNISDILDNTSSIFVNNTSAVHSCGYYEDSPGKTLINDLFCLCVGDPIDAHGPCHPKIWPPKGRSGTNGKWTQIKYGSETLGVIQSFNESFEKIERVCRKEMIKAKIKTERMPALLGEFVAMIGKVATKPDEEGKYIFGHSGRSKHRELVTECDGSVGESDGTEAAEKYNEKICVDYEKNFKNGQYEIAWHNKFREASEKMNEAKELEEKILKNRATLILLKSQAWIAYSREKEDETANLDDMDIAHLLDATKTSSISPFPYLFLSLIL
ncbi:Variant surface glycoprotein [Trypanosoma congolense IL3000]|uniref:Variant surface glycoprotein n=1 Tax=Trypanosoma congolense (strain IL3000) TaxID=1068625 RepID=F9W3W6_TRYCI|nr:Variant surface glycoprotein [Trypanosoma congolense IL3000]